MPVNIGTLEGLIRFRDQSLSTFKKAWENIDKTGEKMEALGRRFSDVGEGMTKAITVPLLAIGGLSVKAASDFESSFAGVRKTVNATEEEFAQLESQLRDLAAGENAIPIDVNELNAVAEAAGQLGIAKDDIISFTRTMADLGETTNLTADEAATATAQFQNIFGAAGKEVSNFGSTLVALGNAGASTEKQIIEMGLRIAGAGVQIGLTQGEVLAFASSLSSVGIEAEAGGSAISKVMINIALATRKGGQELTDFARISGMSVEEFRRAFATDAAGAVTSFIEGLGKMKESGGDVLTTLDQMEITEVRMRDALLRAAGAGDLLSQSLDLQARAWQENTALGDEAAKRYATFESQLKILKQQLQDVAITFGQALLPMLVDFINAVKPGIELLGGMAQGFSELPGPIKLIIVALGGIAAATGPAIYITGQLLQSWGVIAQSAPGLAAAIKSVNLAIAGTGAAVAIALLALNHLINKWKEALNAAIAYQVGAANLEGRAIEFSRVVARGEGKVGSTVYKQAHEDLIALEKQMDEAQKRVNKLNEMIRTANPDQAFIAKGNLKEAQQDLKSTVNAYESLRKSLSKVKTVTQDQDKETNKLNVDLGALTGTVEGLTDAQKDLAKELADTTRDLILSIKHHRELERLYKSNATQSHIDDVEDAHEVYKQYLSDVDKFGKVAADTLRSLNEADLKAARDAEKAHKVWLSRAESMRKFVDQTERLVNLYADQALADLTDSINRDLEDAASLTAAMATDAERWVAEEARAKELLDAKLISQETYDRLLKSHTEELKIQESSWERQRRTVEAIAGEINNWASVFGTVLEGVNDQISTVIGGVEQFTAGLQAYNREGATWSERAMAGVQMGQGIFQVGQGAGLWQGNRGTGSFGGQLSGDYADIGAQIGGMFGPVWGLVGAALGSMIKKGADEGLAQVALVAGDILVGSGVGSDRSLRDVAKSLGNDIGKAIESIMDAIGGELVGLPTIFIKIRDDIVNVTVGQIRQSFKSVEEALSFAISEALRQAQITGLSPEMQAALENTAATTVEEFIADIQLAQWAERLGMSDVQIALDDLTLNFSATVDRLHELGIDSARAAEEYGNQVQKIKDQYLGFNRSTAEWLRNLAGINAGIDAANEDLRRKAEHQVNLLQQQIDNMMTQGPRNLSLPTPGGQPGETMTVRETREQWEAAIAELRRQQENYLDQLNNLPQRMSEAEINMGIFQALFQYLQNSRKYAAQAHKYALLRVEVEFNAIKMQLIAMNKWEEFAQMFNDAYAAARAAAGEQGRGRGRGQGAGGGGGRADAREWLVDRQAEIASRGMSEYARQQAEIIRLYSEQISQAGRDITLRTQLITLRDQELAQLRAQQVGDIVKRFQENIGLVNQFDQVRNSAADFIKDINSSPLGDVRKANMIARVLQSVERTIERMSMETARGLLGEMVADLERFGADQALISEAQRHMAIIEHTLKMSHYQTEIEILKAQGKLAPEVLAALEKSFAFLKTVDPLVLVPPGPDDPPYSPVILVPRDWWLTDETNDFAQALKRARDLLAKYQSDGLLPIVRSLRDINQDFELIYRGVGRTAETIAAHANAVSRAIDQWLEPIRNLRQDLFYGELSPYDTETQFNAALQEFLSAQARFDLGDMGVVDELPEIVQRFMGLLREMTPVGSEAFSDWSNIVDDLLERVEDVTAQDIEGTIDLSDLADLSADQLSELTDISVNTRQMVEEMRSNTGSLTDRQSNIAAIAAGNLGRSNGQVDIVMMR